MSTKLKIRLLLTISALLLGMPAMAVTLKIATVTPEGTRWMKDMRSSAKEIKEKTDGRVQIKYYGGGIKGDDAKVLGQIRIGQLQGAALTPSALASIYSDLNLYGMPLVFESIEEAAYVRGHLDDRLRQGLEDAGFVNFGFAAAGFANILSSEPVRSLADLKGKRVWVPEGDAMSVASMQALSLTPVTLPLTDVMTGLQTGLIDIIAIPPMVALVMQWHTKVKYVTEVPLVYTFGFMAVDKRAFDKISPSDQAIVREVMNATYKNFDESNLAENKGAFAALVKSGVQPTEFGATEFVEVRDVLLKSNRQLGQKGAFSLTLYDEMMRHVGEYRSEHVAADE